MQRHLILAYVAGTGSVFVVETGIGILRIYLILSEKKCCFRFTFAETPEGFRFLVNQPEHCMCIRQHTKSSSRREKLFTT